MVCPPFKNENRYAIVVKMEEGDCVRRKFGRLRKKENIIVFPGTFEKLVEKGITAVDLQNYEEAVEAFDQAIVYEPDYPEFLGPYAVALYETKDFQRAKEISSRLLHSGTSNYIDAIELYLTISIQLQEYEEVEMTIDTLLDEGIIPHDMIKKFTYLRELNNRLSDRYDVDEVCVIDESFTFDAFLEMDVMKQQQMLASLEGTELHTMIPILEDIAESIHLSPLVITFALTLLHQANSTNEVVIRKMGLETSIVPAEMTLPGQDEQTQNVLATIEQTFEKDPSRLELAQNLIEKYSIIAFPFGWGDCEVEEIVASYEAYIESMFSGQKMPDTPLCLLIEQIDNESTF